MAVRKEKEYMFVCDSIPEKSFKFFDDMRHEQEFCDVTFQLETQDTISAHRIIITAAIPYFREVFTNNERRDGEAGISIREIDPNAFKCLIEFAYIHKVKINVENAWNLLGAACCLGVEEVRQACCDFVIDTLEVENAFNARQQASTLNCYELVKDIDCYVAENFIQIAQTNDFLNCSAEYAKEIFSRDDLCVDNEDRVLDALLRWAKSSPRERSVVLPEMMCKVRMLQVKPEILAKLTATEDVIRSSMLCRDLVDEARNYNLFPEMRKEVCSFATEPRETMQISDDDENNHYICRMTRKEEYGVDFYGLTEGKWHSKERKVFSQIGGTFAKAQNKIYFFRWGDTLKYDPKGNKFELLPYKPMPVIYAAAASLRNKIYLFGGQKGNAISNAIECFDPEKNQWTTMKPMRTGRLGLSAVPLGKYIYVLGGRDWFTVYDCIDRYNPVTDKWKSVSSMLSKRCYASVATLNGNIYICGGSTLHDASGVVGTVEVYDPVKNSSSFVAHLIIPRWRFFLVSYSGRLYAVGGIDSNRKKVYTIDIYDSENDKWIVGPNVDSTDLTTGAAMSPDMGN